MNSIKIIANSSYLPSNKITNEFFNKKFNLDDEWIYKRTGIKNRYYTKEETIVDLAINVSKKLIEKLDIDIQKIGNIAVTSTSTNRIMPGISFEVQKALNIEKCMCLDVLAGCSGYINIFDIARKNIILEDCEYALIIGVEVLSSFLDFEDVTTSILLGDGAGATLIGRSDEYKKYFSKIESFGQDSSILTCHNNEKLYMNGKEIYKFAVTKTVENINELLKKSNESIENIKCIIPHQSNIKILNSITSKLKIDNSKMYVNLSEVGNTFCASIPIALDEMFEKKLLVSGDKIILIGYGGGLNLGSILLEI